MTEENTSKRAPSLDPPMERMSPPELGLTGNEPKLQKGPLVGPIDTSRPGAANLAKVAQHWRNSCDGGDNTAWENNCAHFLSDAFIRAGYEELVKNNPHIDADGRCTPAKRPLRARNMKNWFASKATKTSSKIERNTGWWAVFQLDTTHYCCGHVVLLDSDEWKAYGTGWYGDWREQFLYQW